MKAICVHEWGAAEVMRLQEVAEPGAGPGAYGKIVLVP